MSFDISRRNYFVSDFPLLACTFRGLVFLCVVSQSLLGTATGLAVAQSLESQLLKSLENEKGAEARELIAKGADPNARDSDGIAAIHFAAINGDIETVKLLIAKGAKSRVQDSYGGSPLFSAAERGYLEIVKLLLQGGADPDARMTFMGINQTPIEIAAEKGHSEVEQALREARAAKKD